MKTSSFPGSELKARREELGLSVEDIYRKLHISIGFVETIEEGDFQRLPPTCYSVGFLKTYCNALGLSPHRYVAALQECSRPSARFLGMGGRGAREKPPAWASELATWAAICAILALGWVTYTTVIQPDPERARSQVQAGTFELPGATGARNP